MIEIIITDRKFYNQYKNWEDFTGNAADYNVNLAASVMERIQAVTSFSIKWWAEANDVYSWLVEHQGSGLVKFTREAGSFLADGMAVGDGVDWWVYDPPSGVPGVLPGTITSLNETIMYVQFTSWPGTWTPSFFTTEDSQIYGTDTCTAALFKFGLIGNSESFNYLSKVSGDDQIWYASGIGTSYVNMTALGSLNDWVNGSAKIKRTGISAYAQSFEVVHEFILTPYFIEGYLENLQNGTIPDLFDGLNSLKYAFEIEMRKVLSNPNTAKIQRDTMQLGSTAWFNENLNGFDSDYVIDVATTYQDTGFNYADGVLISARTIVTVVIRRLSGNFVAGDRVGVFVSMLPGLDAYTGTLTTMEENFLYDNYLNIIGSGVVTPTTPNGIIKQFQAYLSLGRCVIKFEMEYTPAQQALISSDNYFLIGALVGNNYLTNPHTDRVMLLADCKQYDVAADIPGLIGFDKLEIVHHPDATQYTDMEGFNEDGVLIDFDFWIDLAKEAFINSLDFQVIAFNATTEDYFVIDQYNFPVNSAIVSGGVQQLIVDTIRGYLLKTADQFNLVQISVGARVGDIQHYIGKIAQKIPWQEWIALLGADTIFFDVTEDFNGLNKKTDNYSGLHGYQIKFAFAANMSGLNDLGDTGTTDYLIMTPDIKVNDYDVSVPATALWTASVKTYDATTLTDTAGAILTDRNTLMKITWTRGLAPVAAIGAFWGIHRIEKTGQDGTAIYELSSINDYPTDNPLIPVSGSTRLKISLVAGKIVTECLIDYTKLNPDFEYNLSGTIQDGATIPLPSDVKLTEAGFAKVTEAGDYKIIE